MTALNAGGQEDRVNERWSIADLESWTRALLATHRVVAPVMSPDGPTWAEVTDPDQIVWAPAKTRSSARCWLLPRSEPLFTYDLGGKQPVITEAQPDRRPTALLLLRPCDVAGLRALDPVMRWDYEDQAYEARRRATLLVALSCPVAPSPETCFCESVGIDPSFAADADVVLEPLGDSSFHVYAVSEPGREQLGRAPKPTASGRPQRRDAGTAKIDIEAARAWMRGHFDDPSWTNVSEACLGCGTCAFVCPTCHCFDIVDEGDWRRGCRVRNWDSCAFAHFTVHASGHNPRANQWQRYRQRVYHKFVYYPDKFGPLLCTGCGRCVEACPAGIDLVEVLQGLAARNAAASTDAGPVAEPAMAGASGQPARQGTSQPIAQPEGHRA